MFTTMRSEFMKFYDFPKIETQLPDNYVINSMSEAILSARFPSQTTVQRLIERLNYLMAFLKHTDVEAISNANQMLFTLKTEDLQLEVEQSISLGYALVNWLVHTNKSLVDKAYYGAYLENIEVFNTWPIHIQTAAIVLTARGFINTDVEYKTIVDNWINNIKKKDAIYISGLSLGCLKYITQHCSNIYKAYHGTYNLYPSGTTRKVMHSMMDHIYTSLVPELSIIFELQSVDKLNSKFDILLAHQKSRFNTYSESDLPVL